MGHRLTPQRYHHHANAAGSTGHDGPAPARCGCRSGVRPQARALEDLLGGIRARWRIPIARVVAHSDVAPRRKVDPGPKFDWRRLALSGHAVWPEAEGCGAGGWPAFRRAASRIGYGAPEGDWEAVLAAVRLRFRPEALASPLDDRDVALVGALAEAHPCVDP